MFLYILPKIILCLLANFELDKVLKACYAFIMNEGLQMLLMAVGGYLAIAIGVSMYNGDWADFKIWLSKWIHGWEQGECRGRVARRSRYNGRVEFLLVDTENNEHYWYGFSKRFWREFEANPRLNRWGQVEHNRWRSNKKPWII